MTCQPRPNWRSSVLCLFVCQMLLKMTITIAWLKHKTDVFPRERCVFPARYTCLLMTVQNHVSREKRSHTENLIPRHNAESKSQFLPDGMTPYVNVISRLLLSTDWICCKYTVMWGGAKPTSPKEFLMFWTSQVISCTLWPCCRSLCKTLKPDRHSEIKENDKGETPHLMSTFCVGLISQCNHSLKKSFQHIFAWARFGPSQRQHHLCCTLRLSLVKTRAISTARYTEFPFYFHKFRFLWQKISCHLLQTNVPGRATNFSRKHPKRRGTTCHKFLSQSVLSASLCMCLIVRKGMVTKILMVARIFPRGKSSLGSESITVCKLDSHHKNGRNKIFARPEQFSNAVSGVLLLNKNREGNIKREIVPAAIVVLQPSRYALSMSVITKHRWKALMSCVERRKPVHRWSLKRQKHQKSSTCANELNSNVGKMVQISFRGMLRPVEPHPNSTWSNWCDWLLFDDSFARQEHFLLCKNLCTHTYFSAMATKCKEK